MRVTRDEFERLVCEALEQIPPSFASYLAEIVIDIEDLPDRRTCEAVGVRDPLDLLGLYHGVPLTDRQVEAPVQLPDRISIYQASIERACNSREELVRQIRTTVLHEVGHHFGLDEGDLDALGYA